MKIAEIKKLVKLAIDRKTKIIEASKNATNPQVKEMNARCTGELIALEAIHDAIERNDLVCLKILAYGSLGNWK